MSNRRSLRAGLVAVAGAATLIGTSVQASAAPREWDIGYYDACMADAESTWRASSDDDPDALNRLWAAERRCCLESGGVWSGGLGGGKCRAPSDKDITRTRPELDVPTGPLPTFTPAEPAFQPVP